MLDLSWIIRFSFHSLNYIFSKVRIKIKKGKAVDAVFNSICQPACQPDDGQGAVP